MIQITWWGLWLALSGAAAVGYVLAVLMGANGQAARLDESHAAARYAIAGDGSGEALPPIVETFVAAPSKHEIAAARSIVTNEGDCMGKPLSGSCFGGCPFCEDDCAIPEERNLERARAWLASHGIPVEEPLVDLDPVERAR